MIKRNWPALQQIGKTDQFLMLALITANTRTTTGKKLKAAFPDCFKHVKGPIPLSVLKAECERRTAEMGEQHTYQWRYADLVKDFSLPAVVFCYNDGHKVGSQVNLPDDLVSSELTKEELVQESGQGKVIPWKDKKFLVAENVGGHITLVPVECLDMAA